MAVGLSACNSDNDTDLQTGVTTTTTPTGTSPPTTSQPSPTTRTNRAPTITGTPPKAVVSGTTYSFQPSASDADNHPIAFTITSKPTWASFSTSTGKLQGTPTVNDVGKYNNIVITVTDGMAQTALPPFSVEVMGTASGAIVVNFTPPTQRTDGSAFTDLGGYKLYWGTAVGNYPSSVKLDQGVSSYMIEQLPRGTYYLVATVFDSKGIESDFSNVVTKTL